jgi:tetratricopeptide (TPR) repeat protein
MPPISLMAGCLTIPTDLDNADGAATTAPATAQELLDRHIAASGGAEALRSLTQRTIEARVVFEAQEGCQEGDRNCIYEELVGQLVRYNTADGRMYRRMVVGDRVIERGFDGENGWQMQSEPQLLVLEDPLARPILREEALLHWYLDVDDEARDGLALDLLPSRTTDDGRLLDGIRWFASSPSTPETEKWFDRATGLLAEEIERDTDSGDLVRSVYEDYRESDGVQVPWRVRQLTEIAGYPDGIIDLRVQVVHHRPVREELSAVPDLEPPARAPDQLLATLAAARAEAEADADDTSAQVTHARWAFMAGHFDEAREAAKRTLKLDKDELEATYVLARVALLEGDLRGAEELVRKAVAKGLREDEASRQLAWIHLRRGQWDKAAEAFRKAGSPAQANRYKAFQGPPLAAKMGGDGCVTTLPMKIEQGVVVVEVDADGATLRLTLDTSVADLMLSESRSKALGIFTDAEIPFGDRKPRKHGQLDQLTIGDLSVSNVPVAMVPDEEMASVVGNSADGILGVRAFADRQLTVDSPARVLQLVEPGRRCKKQLEANRVGTPVRFWLHETHYIYVIGQMNGAEGVYMLSTGMQGADLSANEIAYAHAGVGAPPIRPNSVPLVHIERFELGDYSLTDLGGAFGVVTNNATSDRFRLDGMLGLEVLGRGRWTLDFEEQRLYIQRPPKTQTPTQPETQPETKTK